MTAVVEIPSTHSALILRGPYQRYEIAHDWPRPNIERPNEVLIRVSAIGLNPVLARFPHPLPLKPFFVI